MREARKFNRELFMKICAPLAERSTFIKPGDEVVPGITAVDAFGHSPGLLAFHDRERRQALHDHRRHLTQYVMAVQRPDWYFDMDDDKDKAVATRKRMLDMLATDKTACSPASTCRSPASAGSSAAGAGYRWVPHSYQLNLVVTPRDAI